MKTDWRFEKTVSDGEVCEIDGTNIWDYKWEDTGEKIKVKDPVYSKFYRLEVYKIQNDTIDITFAAGEFSNCVWGIYLRENNV